MQNYAKIKKKVDRAKLKLFTLKETTFFSALLSQLRLEIGEKYPTAATNGLTLWLNPAFVEPLSLDETVGLLLHETMHVAWDHIVRAKELKVVPAVWNQAGDYVINNEAKARGFSLPPGGFIDHKYKGWSTKQVYDELIKLDQPVSSAIMLDISLDTPEGMDEKEAKERVIGAVVKAVTQARLSGDAGSIPGEVLRSFDEMIEPKLPWQTILQQHMSTYRKEEYSWTRPNRRYYPGFYLPQMRSESLDQVSVFIDSSGSISNEDIGEFMAEIRYMWDTLKPKTLKLVVFDTQIKSSQTFTEGDSLSDVRIRGGGGTNIGPVARVLEKEQPELAIIFTDMEFPHVNYDRIQSDIIWIQYGDYSNPPTKGEVIKFDQ